MGVGCLSLPPIETSHPLSVPPGQPSPVTILRGTPEWVLGRWGDTDVPPLEALSSEGVGEGFGWVFFCTPPL